MTDPGGRRIARERLETLLDDGVRRALTLVVAGPGWGKTTLLRSWTASRRRRHSIVWLPLGPDFHAEVRKRQCGRPVVWVLDDLHAADDTQLMAGLATLLDDPPTGIRIVALSRTEPALPLHRLRAAGQLAEIRPAALAFDRDEAAALRAEDLIGRTWGWPLGVRMTAEQDGEAAVGDYLLREVVTGQPPAVRDFLRRTAVPDRVCAGLAAALTGEKRGEQILDGLGRTSGFVTRLAPDSRWFGYQPQLRDALRRQLQLDEPDAVAGAHGLAARWYAGERLVPEALRHAAAASDWPYLGRVVAELAPTLIVSASRGTLVEILRRIPADQLGSTPELTLCAALLMFANGNFPAIAELISRARAMLAGRFPAQRMAVDAALGMLEAGAVLRVRGDMPALVSATTDLLERLHAARLERVPTLLQLRAIAQNDKGVGLLWTERLDQAEHHLWAGLNGARVGGLELVEINARAHLGLLAFLRGSLAEAGEHVTAARDLARRHDVAGTPQAAWAHLTLALIELERDRAAEAQAALRNALHSEMNPPEAATGVVSSLVRVHLLLAGDDPATAADLLRDTRAGVDPALTAPLLERWLRVTEAEVALAEGGAERVIALFGRDRTPGLTPAEQVCLGRAFLALGDHGRAGELLTRAAESPDAVSAVTAWIALALLAGAEGHGQRSADAMVRAEALARRDGIRRPFRRLAGGQLPGNGLVEPLSERETDVLRFLPTVLTAAEIAESLGISVNTVKAHLRSIYRKLGVARRREAVVLARRLGLQ